MKNAIKWISVIALVAVMVITTASCSKSGGGKNINSADELKKYLDSQHANSLDKPIKVSMSVNDMMIENVLEIIRTADKFVSLDLSRSTGLTVIDIDDEVFWKAKALVSITIPESVTEITNIAVFPNLTSITFLGNKVDEFYGMSGDLDEKYRSGGAGTYTTTAPLGDYPKWTKQSGSSNKSASEIKSGDGSVGGSGKRLNSAEDLKAYLDKQPVNGSDKPIKIAMKLNETMFNEIRDVINDAGKYVSLDLSGSPLTTIPDSAFYDDDKGKGCKLLSGIIIPDGVTSIGNSAFAVCSSLTSITIPDSVTSIEDYAFAVCSSLTNVTIGNSVTSIGKGAFFKCESLTSVTIPDSVTVINGAQDNGNGTYNGRGAFEECTSLTSVTKGSGVTSIGGWTFVKCKSLKGVTIPTSVTSIGGEAFAGCTSLTSLTFQGTIPSSGLYASVPPFDGDLRAKYLAGGVGTYTRPNGESKTWTKQ